MKIEEVKIRAKYQKYIDALEELSVLRVKAFNLENQVRQLQNETAALKQCIKVLS